MEVERVTLGVVGDAGVGKTTLVVSFTANYVCQEYRPTALDAFSTIVRLNDALVVDLRIWDNAGSKEYCGLRPLTYPQTEVFLVCFSLKSRKSFENVTRVWISEIYKTVGTRPFVLVGCKRDDCVLGADGNSDVVGTIEGEAMARRLGAVTYVETSAIEQSGFTDCFHTAIHAALEERKSPTLARDRTFTI